MLWDGLFHALTWTMTALGLALLWRAGQRADIPWSTRTFLGSLPLAWGIFNPVEGVIDHYLLNIHHVYERARQSVYDAAFRASGVVLIGLGWWIIRSGSGDMTPRGQFAP
jgi:uncharacterized membrane protein